MKQPFADLDLECRPAKRPVTALGRLVIGWASAFNVPGPDRNDNGCERYWCNRPGQHHGENFFIAGAVTLTVFGLVLGWMVEWFYPLGFWDVIEMAIALIPGFFLVIHLLIFAASGVELFAHLLEITPNEPPGHFPGRVFLLLLTAICGINLFRGGASWLTLMISAAWCLLVSLNVIAALLHCFRSLQSALASH